MKSNGTPSLWATLAPDTFLCVAPEKFVTEKVFYLFPDKADTINAVTISGEKKKSCLFV